MYLLKSLFLISENENDLEKELLKEIEEEEEKHFKGFYKIFCSSSVRIANEILHIIYIVVLFVKKKKKKKKKEKEKRKMRTNLWMRFTTNIDMILERVHGGLESPTAITVVEEHHQSLHQQLVQGLENG